MARPLALLLALIILLASFPTHAENVVIVLDGSGSMWGQIQGKPKIAIAKEVVKELLGEWNPDSQLGLTVYGHRRKGDCEDIEALVPVAPININTSLIRSKVDSITPKGKTPLSKAVLLAAKELRYSEKKATVILVSDGIETCDYDPCQVAAELESTGVDFTAHVIGFDVSEEEALKQLRCMAENTGGRFLSAKNSEELHSSLKEAVRAVEQPKENVKFHAVHAPGDEPLQNVHWQVFEGDSEKNKSVAWGGGALPAYALSPGSYTVVVESTDGPARAVKQFEVPEEKVLEVEVVLPLEGSIVLTAVNAPGEEPLSGVTWNVFEVSSAGEKGKGVAYGRGAQPEYTLLPGEYIAEVSSIDGPAKAEKRIEIIAGKKNSAEVVLSEEGQIVLSARNDEKGEILKEVAWTVNTITELGEKGENVAYGRGAQPTYSLLPGTYLAEVRSLTGKAVNTQKITVEAGKKKSITVLLAAEGIIKLIAVHNPEGAPVSNVSWKVYTNDASAELVTYGKGAEPEYKLLPGKYLAKVTSLGGKAQAEGVIEVIAGKKSQAEVLLPEEGIVKLSAVTAPGGTPLKEVRWNIFTVVADDSMEKPELVTYGKGASPEYKLLPGRYTAKVESTQGKAKAEQEIEVIPGKKNSIEVIFPDEGDLELTALGPKGEKVSRASWKLFSLVPKDSMEEPELIHYGSGASRTFRVLPGQYRAVLSAEGKTVEKEVTALPGKRVKEILTVSN